MVKPILLLVSLLSISAHKLRGSLLTNDMFNDVDPKQFAADLDAADDVEDPDDPLNLYKKSDRKGGHVAIKGE